MKIKLLLLATFISIKVLGQNDTIIYYSKYYAPVQTLTEATYYEKLIKSANNKFILFDFKNTDGKWKQVAETKIRRLTDTSFLLSSTDEVVRIYHKVDGGYLINDVQKNNSRFFVNRTGFSNTIFPLIKSGLWKDYNPLTGDILFEYQYTNIQKISFSFNWYY